MDDELEPWRNSYLLHGREFIEPAEYIPCPGSIEFCRLKVQREEEKADEE